LPVEVFVVVCHRDHGVSEFQARSVALARIVAELQDAASVASSSRAARTTVTTSGRSTASGVCNRASSSSIVSAAASRCSGWPTP
jgi:hypothetical protein